MFSQYLKTSWTRVHTVAGLVFAVLVGLTIRGMGLNNTGLTIDEAFSWRLTEYSSPEIIRRTAMDVHPPLFYLLLKAWLSLSGLSPIKLRGLSIVFSALIIIMGYVLAVESLKLETRQPRQGHPQVAGLVCALLFACHALQINAGHLARMYSLGVLLALTTAWLLLRALRAGRCHTLWWTAYGSAVAMFCYTHYYAFFTILAQSIFCASYLWRHVRAASFRAAASQICGVTYAGVLALILYLPWLPVFVRQSQAVQQDYWIRPLRLEGIARSMLGWCIGVDTPPNGVTWLAIGVLVATVCWLAKRAGHTGMFLLCQALLPWILAIGISLVSGRSILDKRYLVFALAGFLAFWGTSWVALPCSASRSIFTMVVGAVCAYGIWKAAASLPDSPPAIELAAMFLKEHYEKGDIVEIRKRSAMNNRLRCYAACVGFTQIDVRTLIDTFGRRTPMQYNHEAVFQSTDIITERERSMLQLTRLWSAIDGEKGLPENPPEGMTVAFSRVFQGGLESRYTLTLFVRHK